MRSFITLVAAGLIDLGSAGQVNFYFDQSCQDFVGSVNVPSFTISGGPAGSHSAMWISRDQAQCSDTCGALIICADSNCNTRHASSQWPASDACHGFASGLWVKNGCGEDMCGKA